MTCYNCRLENRPLIEYTSVATIRLKGVDFPLATTGTESRIDLCDPCAKKLGLLEDEVSENNISKKDIEYCKKVEGFMEDK